MLIRPTSRVLSRGFTRRLGAVEFVPVPVDLNDTGNHEATDRCQAALLPRFVELLKQLWSSLWYGEYFSCVIRDIIGLGLQ